MFGSCLAERGVILEVARVVEPRVCHDGQTDYGDGEVRRTHSKGFLRLDGEGKETRFQHLEQGGQLRKRQDYTLST